MTDMRVVSDMIEHSLFVPSGISRVRWQAAAIVTDPPPVWVIGREPITIARIFSEVVVVTLSAINNVSHDGTIKNAGIGSVRKRW